MPHKKLNEDSFVISQKTAQERRKDQRLAKNVPVKIFHDDGDIVTQTANISRSGAYCRVEKYIEPMTKLKVNLLLPIKKNGKSTSKRITCQGAVVRTEKISAENAYHIAIFFSDISQREAESIADYIAGYLEEDKKA